MAVAVIRNGLAPMTRLFRSTVPTCVPASWNATGRRLGKPRGVERVPFVEFVDEASRDRDHVISRGEIAIEEIVLGVDRLRDPEPAARGWTREDGDDIARLRLAFRRVPTLRRRRLVALTIGGAFVVRVIGLGQDQFREVVLPLGIDGGIAADPAVDDIIPDDRIAAAAL